MLVIWPKVAQSWSLQALRQANGDLLQEDLAPKRTSAAPPTAANTSAAVPVAGHCQHTPPQETLKHSQARLAQSLRGSLLLFPGSWCARGFVCTLQESPFPLGLWKFCNQLQMIFKARFPGDTQSLCWIPRLGSLMWGLEPLQQFRNSFGVIILQIMGHQLNGSMVGPQAPLHG